MAVAIRSETANFTTGGTNPTNTAVTVPLIENGDVVVALVTHARNSTNTITSVSSSNLGTLTQRVTQYGGTTRGEARIYANAYSGTTLTNEVVTLACDNSATNDTQSLTVVVLSGAKTDFTGIATGTNSQASTTAGTVSVTATGSDSYLYGCAQGWSGGFNATAGTDTTEVSDQPDAGNSNYAMRSTNRGGSGSRTLAWTWGTATVTDSAAIEIESGIVGTQTDTAVASDLFGLLRATAEASAFQANAFQENAFQIPGGTAGGGGSFSATQSDSAQASDSLEAANFSLYRDQTDNAQASDTFALALVKLVDQADTAQASDSLGIALLKRVDQTDAAQANDQFDIALTKNVLQTDTALASDTLGIALVKPTEQTDTAQASDAADVARTIAADIDETNYALMAFASDQFAVVLASAGAIADSFASAAQANDDFAFAMAAVSELSEAAQASDALDYAIGIATSVADSAQADDAIGLEVIRNVAQSDSAVALDSLAFALAADALSAAESDSAVASDAMEAVGGTVPAVTGIQAIYLWSGAAWVQWNGSAWV